LFKRTKLHLLVAALSAFLLIIAFPTAASATAFLNVTMDRTTAIQGESIGFTVRTTVDVNYVFAMVDGVRAQAAMVTEDAETRDWALSTFPSRTTNVNIFANDENNEVGAASISLPVTIVAPVVVAATPAEPIAQAVVETTEPAAPLEANVREGVSIVNITEVTAPAVNTVRLSVVTGPQANYTWVRFDGDRYVQGRLVEQNVLSRTWTIDFRPRNWSPQQVQVGSNRTYDYPGASLRNFDVLLGHPAIPDTQAFISNVTVSPREVNPGARTTFTIRTNADAAHVWVRDAEGREHNARSVSPTTTTSRTWEVSFNPMITGNVTVFANTIRSEAGADIRAEHITVRSTQRATISHAWAERTGSGLSSVRISATTNRDAATVWAVLTCGRRIQLNRTDTGTGHRSWEAWVSNVPVGASIVVQVSNQTGQIHLLTPCDTRSVSNWDWSSSWGQTRCWEWGGCGRWDCPWRGSGWSHPGTSWNCARGCNWACQTTSWNCPRGCNWRCTHVTWNCPRGCNWACTWDNQWSTGAIESVRIECSVNQVTPGGTISFRVRTTGNVSSLNITGTHVSSSWSNQWSAGSGVSEFIVTVQMSPTTPWGSYTLTVTARDSWGRSVASRLTPTIFVMY